MNTKQLPYISQNALYTFSSQGIEMHLNENIVTALFSVSVLSS